MPTSGKCPRCGTTLTASPHAPGQLTCNTCRGAFVPAAQIASALLDEAQTDHSSAPGERVIALPPVSCPSCTSVMELLWLGDLELDRCSSCGGVWFDAGESLPAADAGNPLAKMAFYFVYGLTLPERTVRSVVGLTSGTAMELSSFLVPQAFQSSKTYEIVVRNSLRFLTEDIAGVQKQVEDAAEDPVGEHFLARKAVGNFLDWTSFLTLHISPMWILAIVSDVAYGSKSYVLELARELQAQGLIAPDSTIHHIDDILDAIQDASGRTATMFDAPPINVQQLRESLGRTKAALESADLNTLLPQSELRHYWEEMRGIANRADVTLMEVSTAMTLHSLGKLTSISRGALTGVTVVGGLLNRHVIGHYGEALRTLREKGFYETVRDSYAPYVEAVWNNFAAQRDTWTAGIVTGRYFTSAFQSVRSWLFSATPPPSNTQQVS